MLDEFAVGGVKTNIAFLRRILAHPAFAAAELDTGFIPRHQDVLLPTAQALSDEGWEAAAQAWLQSEPPRTRLDDPHSPWAQRDGLRLGAGTSTTVHLTRNGHDQVITLNQTSQGLWGLQGDWLMREQSGLRTRHLAIRRGASLYLHWDGELHTFEAFDPVTEAAIDLAHQGGLTAPMNGSIVRVLVEVGQAVEAGAPLVVLEAMKMEHSIRAPKATTVKALLCQEGDMVSEGAAVVERDS